MVKTRWRELFGRQQEEKLVSVNLVLNLMGTNTSVSWVPGKGWVCFWQTWNGKQIERRYQRKGRSEYPVWHAKWGHGGTCCRGLFQLIRWLDNKPVMPLSIWGYWCGPLVKVGPPEIVNILQNAGYPQDAYCVVCGGRIKGSMDWWDDKKVSGPAHFHAWSKCLEQTARK